MGQRLNIEILNNGELLANCYQHWSAYTRDSLVIALDILDNKYIDDVPNVETAVRILENACEGSGLYLADLEYAKEHGFAEELLIPATNRNDGLISITEEQMENTRGWEEGRVSIDLTRKMVDFNVWFPIWDGEEEDYSLPVTHKNADADPYDISFEDFRKFAHRVLTDMDEADKTHTILFYDDIQVKPIE